MYEGDRIPKLANQKIFENNINKKPIYPSRASPRQIGDLAERLETSRQMTGEMSTWDAMKATAKTPQEKKEIRDIIKEDYKRHGAKDMADADLRWIGKSKYAPIADFKIDAEDVIVFHDDLDIEFGKIKAKFGGSSAGHNGIASIDKFIGKDYSRVRIGIGKPDSKISVSDHVLNDFNEDEQEHLEKITENIIESISILIDKKLDLFSSSVNNN